jgi:hypothetical protein
MLNDAFGRDWACRAYGEDGGLALGSKVDHHLRWRWRPLPEVAARLRACKVPLQIAKPIVESQRATELLDFFPEARAIWMYRHYSDVAHSALVKFGTDPSIYNLGAVLDPARRSHWYSQNLADETRQVVARHFDPQRPLPDLKALGWYVRNSLYFQLGLDRHHRVVACRYEQVVADPAGELEKLYSFLRAPFPGRQICDGMHSSSVNKGSRMPIADDIRTLCDELLDRLDESRNGQAATRFTSPR